MPPTAPAAPADTTILNAPEPTPVPVKAPEDVIFTPPPDPAKPAPATPDKPVADAPATPAPEPKPPTDASKPEVPATPAKPPVELDLKLPGGSFLNVEDLEAFKKDAKDSGLTQEEANALLADKEQTAKAVVTRLQADQKKQIESAKVLWKEQSQKDPEIAGVTGTELAKNIELGKRAWDKLASPSLRQMAEETGFASHPEVVRLMVRIGKLFAEDTLVRGDVGSTPGKKAPEDILFGNPQSGSVPIK